MLTLFCRGASDSEIKMTTPGEGAKKPRFVPYNAQLLAESAQELMNKCEQQKKAMPELATTINVSSGAPIQRGVSQDNEWESSLSNWKSKRRSSGGTYQPKVIDIDMDTGNEIPAVSDTNSKRKSTALKDLSESRGDSGGRGYLYPVDDMENIQPNKRTETRQSVTNSPRNSESFDNGNTVLRTPSYTTITTTVITLPTIDDEKVNDNEKSFTTTTTVTSVDVKSPTSRDVPDELNTRNSRSSVIFTTDSALEAKSSEGVKISGESFWSGDSKVASTAPQGPTMVMRDRNFLSGTSGVSGGPRPTSEFMSNRLANFQKEESVSSKPDKPMPAARPRLNVSQWESNLNTTQQPEGVVKRAEPARQGAQVRNFLSHYETGSQSREEDVTNTKPALSSLEERLGKSLGGGKETEVKSKHEADPVKNEIKLEIKPEIITPQESRLQDSPSDKADDGVRPKSEPNAAPKPAPEPNDTKDVTDGLILSRLSGSPRPKSPESRPVRPISPKPRSPRPSSPEVGQNGSQATTKDLSNGDSKPSGPSVSQLSKALGSKLTNLPGALGGMRPPNKEPPAVKPRPAPPTTKPKPEAPKARPRPESLSKDSNGISEEEQNAASSHGVILRVSRPEGAPHSELDLIPSTNLLDSSASKSRSRLSNCGGLKLRRKPTLNRGNQNSLITPKLQNGDSGEPTSTLPTMTHITEHEDEVDHDDVKNDDVVDNKINSSNHDVTIPAVDVSIKLEAAPILTETTPSLNKNTPTLVDTSLSSLEPVKIESHKKIEDDFDTKKSDTILVDKLIDTADVNIDIVKPVSSTHKEIEVEKKNDEILDVTIPKSSNLEGSSIMDGPPEDAPPPLPSCPPPELDFDNLSGGKGGPGGAESAREEQMRRKYEFLGLSADQSEEYKAVKSSENNPTISTNFQAPIADVHFHISKTNPFASDLLQDKSVKTSYSQNEIQEPSDLLVKSRALATEASGSGAFRPSAPLISKIEPTVVIQKDAVSSKSMDNKMIDLLDPFDTSILPEVKKTSNLDLLSFHDTSASIKTTQNQSATSQLSQDLLGLGSPAIKSPTGGTGMQDQTFNYVKPTSEAIEPSTDDFDMAEFDPLMSGNLSKSKSKSVGSLNLLQPLSVVDSKAVDFSLSGQEKAPIDSTKVISYSIYQSSEINDVSVKSTDVKKAEVAKFDAKVAQESKNASFTQQGMRRFRSQENLTRKTFQLPPPRTSAAMTTVTGETGSIAMVTRLNGVPKQRLHDNNSWIKKN